MVSCTDEDMWYSHVAQSHTSARTWIRTRFTTMVCTMMLVIGACAVTGVTPAFGAVSGQTRYAQKQLTMTVTTNMHNPKVTMTISQHLAVTLTSTYWLIRPVVGDVVRSIGSAYRLHNSTCHPIAGNGCGEIVATFVAVHRGSTTVRANRNSCGEALRCSAANSHWQVSIYVR